MRITFAGTPTFAAVVLAELLRRKFDVVSVLTQPDSASGRGLKPVESPVKQLAKQQDIAVQQPPTLKDPAAVADLGAHRPDVLVVVAYGLILPPAVLALPRLGCLNVHASLLPRWRGAAPIQRAIMDGDAETGMMVMKMDEGLDTGPVALTRRVAIDPDMTAGELHDALMDAGAALMVEALAALEKGALALTPQPEAGATYARKIAKEETRIDWSLPAAVVHDRIRGLSPFPGAWCEMQAGGKAERVKLLRSTRADGTGRPGEILDEALTVACGDGAVRLVEVQRAGGRAMGAEEFLRGAKLGRGDFLS